MHNPNIDIVNGKIVFLALNYHRKSKRMTIKFDDVNNSSYNWRCEFPNDDEIY